MRSGAPFEGPTTARKEKKNSQKEKQRPIEIKRTGSNQRQRDSKQEFVKLSKSICLSFQSFKLLLFGSRYPSTFAHLLNLFHSHLYFALIYWFSTALLIFITQCLWHVNNCTAGKATTQLTFCFIIPMTRLLANCNFRSDSISVAFVFYHIAL